MTRQNLFKGKYPLTLKALAVISIVWMVGTLAWCGYEQLAGIPIAEILNILVPSGMSALVLIIVSTAWKGRIDKADTGNVNESPQATPSGK